MVQRTFIVCALIAELLLAPFSAVFIVFQPHIASAEAPATSDAGTGDFSASQPSASPTPAAGGDSIGTEPTASPVPVPSSPLSSASESEAIPSPVPTPTPTVAPTPTPEPSDSKVQAASAAQATPDQHTGVLPQNSGDLIAKPKFPEVRLGNGALTYEYPLRFPPGRLGIEPSLRLAYNSQEQSNINLVGYGWELEIPAVSRMNRRGVKGIYAYDDFTATFSGELNPTDIRGQFVGRVDTGEFLVYAYDEATSSWRLADKNGNVYRFGAIPESRLADPADPKRIARWFIDELRDPHGNFVSYRYELGENKQPYLKEIIYTNYEEDGKIEPGLYRISFTHESRPDTVDSYQFDFRIANVKRLQAIELYVGSRLAKKYELGYGNGVNGVRSLLASITETGFAADGTITALPPTTFDYTKGRENPREPDGIGHLTSIAWWRPVPWSEPTYPPRRGDIYVDLNGDGYLDSFVAYPNPGSSEEFVTNVTMNSRGVPTNPGPISNNPNFPHISFASPYNASTALTGENGRVFDIEGDGLADFFGFPPRGTKRTVFRNESAKAPLGTLRFASPVETHEVDPIRPNHYLADFDGIGITGFYHEGEFFGLDLNGDGIDEKMKYDCCGRLDKDKHDMGVRFIDVNADGLIDRLRGWRLIAGPGGPGIPGFYDAGYPFGDYNEVEINIGGGFVRNTSLRSPYFINMEWVGTDYRNTMTDYFDTNGDGIVDDIFPEPVTTRADLLKTITYPTGGKTSATYKPSTHYRDAEGKLLNPRLPLILWTVERLVTEDGTGGAPLTQTFTYANGHLYWNGTYDRKFAGFGKITSDDGLAVTVTYYHQANGDAVATGEQEDSYGKMGRQYLVEVRDRDGKILNREWSIYGEAPHPSARPLVGIASSTPSFVYLEKQISEIYGENDEPGVSASELNEANDNGFEFGDGRDGAAVIASDTTLTSDKYYTNLTIQNGATLFPNGYRIFVTGTLTLGGAGAGTVARDGNKGGDGEDARTLSGRGGQGGTGLPAGYLSGSAAGTGGAAGSANSGGGSGGRGTGANHSLGGNGGAGGDGGRTNYTGSSGGGGGIAIPAQVPLQGPWSALHMMDKMPSGATVPYESGGGGGGGGSGAWESGMYFGATGGGGGSAGGIIAIYARKVVIYSDGTIRSKGGDGGRGGNGTGISRFGGAGGGGGGGAGGFVLLVHHSLMNSGGIVVGGGAGGRVGSDDYFGSATAGKVGTDGIVRLLNASTYGKGDGHRDHATEYRYDTETGNLREVRDLGEVITASTRENPSSLYVDTGKDSVRTMFEYAVGLTLQALQKHYERAAETIYDHSGKKVAETRYYYDHEPQGALTRGDETKRERWIMDEAATPRYAATARTYRRYGLSDSVTNENLRTTTTVYDEAKLYPREMKNPLGHATAMSYDYGVGKIAETVEPNGAVRAFRYDGLGRLVEERVTDPGTLTPAQTPLIVVRTREYRDTPGSVRITERAYRSAGSVTETARYFDGLGRPVQERRNGSLSEECARCFEVNDTAYNTQGRVERESLTYRGEGAERTAPTDRAALYTNYRYDALGRLVEARDAIGAERSEYSTPWVTSSYDRMGHRKDFVKDAFSRLVEVGEYVSGETLRTRYGYDARGNLAVLTDALGNVRRFTYDGLSRRLLAEDLHAPEDATFGVWKYRYDDAGNLLQTEDPRGTVINYGYDELERVLRKDNPATPTLEAQYRYDGCQNGLGRLCVVKGAGVSKSAYSYDSGGRVSTEGATIDGGYSATGFTYDWLGNLLRVTLPDGSLYRYAYDDAGRVSSVEQQRRNSVRPLPVANFRYAPHGGVTEVRYANGRQTATTYDSERRYRLVRKVTTVISEVRPLETESAGDGPIEALSVPHSAPEEIPDASPELGKKTSFLRVLGDKLAEVPYHFIPRVAHAATVPPAQKATPPTIAPQKITVASGETVALTYGVPKGALPSAKLYLSCPSGITSSDERDGTDWCNRLRTFSSPPTRSDITFFNRSAEAKRVTPNFYTYFPDRPTFAVGKSSEIAVLPLSEKAPPFIRRIIATPARIGIGETVRISWLLDGGAVKILDFSPVAQAKRSGENVMDIVVSTTTTYTLRVRNDYGEAVRTIQVQVFIPTPTLPAPVITPSGGIFGEPQLVRIVSAKPEVSIHYTADGSAPARSSPRYLAPFTVEKTAVVQAIVFGEKGERSSVASTTITMAPPAIKTFSAVPPIIAAGGSAMLSWSFEGNSGTVSTLTLTPGIVGSRVATSTVVSPATTTVYTLVAANRVGTSTASFTVTVLPPPKPLAYGKVIQDISYSYDDNGNITRIVDASDTDTKKTLEYRYDDLSRLLSATASGSRDTAENYAETFTYDALGNLLTKTRTVEQAVPESNATTTLAAFTFDGAAGNETSLSASFINADLVLSSKITRGTGLIPTIGANEFNSYSFTPSSERDPDDYYSIKFLPASGRSILLAEFSFDERRSSMGPRNWELRTSRDNFGTVLASGVLPNNKQYRNQIVSLTGLGNIAEPIEFRLYGAASGSGMWRLDNLLFKGKAGGRTKTTGAQTYSYNGSRGTTVANPHAATAIETTNKTPVAFSYDRTGNLLSGDGFTYAWNYDNRLVRAGDGLSTTTYGYDASGQRTWKKTGNTTTIYPNKYYEVTYAPGRATTTTSYLFAGDILIATVVGNGIATSSSYIHQDHLGSTGVVTDEKGEVVQVLDYYPYGTERLSQGQNPTNRHYIGERLDAESGLNYLNARYYDGRRGQFMSQDPVYLALGDPSQIQALISQSQAAYLRDPQQLNSYSYAGSNPITHKDPKGLSAAGVPMGPWGIVLTILFSPIQGSYDPVYEAEQYQAQNSSANQVMNLAVGWAMPGGGKPTSNLVKVESGKIADGLKLGQSFGKLGKVTENVSGKINSFDPHALMRMEQRGMDRSLMDKVVSNPLVTLKQAGDRTLYLTREAAVVVDNTGKVITTYTKNEFKPHVLNVLKSIKKN